MAPAGFRLLCLCLVVLLSPPTVLVLAQVTPTLSCRAEPTKVYIGEPITLSSTASTTIGRTLTSVWGTTAGRIGGTGPTVKLDTTGVALGTYTATVRADDGRGGFADCTVQFTVEAPPLPKPPVVSCSGDKTSVITGEVVNLQATASSPDNRPLIYGWTVADGQIEGSGAAVRWDTSGLSAGTYAATGRISDDRGLSADCTVTVDVQVPPAPPRVSHVERVHLPGELAARGQRLQGHPGRRGPAPAKRGWEPCGAGGQPDLSRAATQFGRAAGQ